jgi:hypothetical protein
MQGTEGSDGELRDELIVMVDEKDVGHQEERTT